MSKYPQVFTRDGYVYADSRDISQHLPRRHDNLCRRIRTLRETMPTDYLVHEYVGENGQRAIAYHVTQTGLKTLVAGFSHDYRDGYDAAFAKAEQRIAQRRV